MVALVFDKGRATYFDSSFSHLFGTISTKTWTLTDTGGRTETWGTFTVGETVSLENKDSMDQIVTTFSGKFEGTFVRSGTEAVADRTYLVFSYEDATYGTRYVLIGPETSDANATKISTEFDAESDIVKENLFIPCFLRGTLIATPKGERRVEELAAGDLVLTTGGGGGVSPRTREMARSPHRLDDIRSCGEAHARAFCCRCLERRSAA